MDRIRVGLIGCGVIGRTHAEAARAGDGLDLVAVADLIPERAQAYAAEFGVPQVYVQGDDLIEQADVDIVVLALPCCGRLPLALHAFAKGRHVLTEKPVAMSTADVDAMIAARGSLKAACCSSRFRFTDSAHSATAFIANGHLGELRVLRSQGLIGAGKPPSGAPPEWRLKKHLNGGGILMNWGCYDLDYLLGLTGWQLQPVSVFAQTWSITEQFAAYAAPDSEAETHLTALVRFAGGAVLNYERGEFLSQASHSAWSITGTKGTLHLHMTPGRNTLTFDQGVGGEGVVSEVIHEGSDDGKVTSRGPLQDLAAAIRGGTDPLTPLEYAHRVQQISDAIYASAASGQVAVVG